MATPADARAVKSLNTGDGSRKFVYKSNVQQIAELDINVYRSLDPVKAEPSEGSTFFRDCLIEWRELNTAEDFISFYQEMFPLVQTLPQIILQKKLIVSKLLSRLQMQSRLSLEPILRLIAALSRDLLEDFLPFLQRIVNAIMFLLNSGGDKDPDIIKQIFTSWSYIMMFLQKYLIKDVVHVLKVTVKLRCYPHVSIQKFVAESISFLLRNAPAEQLIKGVRKVMIEVVKNPLAERKSGATELLWHVISGTSSRLHSRAPQVLRLLLHESLFSIGDQLFEDPDCLLEIVLSTFKRLNNEAGPVELNLIWDCLHGEIIESVTNAHTVHLSRLLSVLVLIVENGYMKKSPDYQPMFELLSFLVQTYVTSDGEEAGKQSTDIIIKLLQLSLFMIDGLHKANDLSALSKLSCWLVPVFSLKNPGLLTFLKDLVSRECDVLKIFRINILSALSDLVDISEEETVYLLLRVCENLKIPSSSFLDGISNDKLSPIYNLVQRSISYWIETISNALHENLSSLHLEESRSALLWGAIKCYPYLFNVQQNLSLLLDLVNSIDELLMIESEFSEFTWQSLIGAALGSYNEILSSNEIRYEESAIRKFLYLAKKYHSVSQILAPVADILDSQFGSVMKGNTSFKRYHPDLAARNIVDALAVFAKNLCHCDQMLRQSTLRVLCHYEPLKFESFNGRSDEKNAENDTKQTCDVDVRGDNVLELLLSVETIHPSSTDRKIELLLSRIQMNISARRIDENYVPALLYSLIGIFHIRLSNLWDPAKECLTVLMSQNFGIVWEPYMQTLDHCQSFLISCDQSSKSGTLSLNQSTDLVGYFNCAFSTPCGSTPRSTVYSLMIQLLQKVPSLAESRSRQLMPLFLKFLGYNVDDLLSVELYNACSWKGKEWKEGLKEWLNLFSLLRNPKSFYRSQFIKDTLLYRLLDETDAELQLKVLDCLLNWKDDFLLPYRQHLKDMINAKNLREELTRWSLSRESNEIDEQHRALIVPIVIRILVPKVRNLKALASRKHASVHQRRAILGFLAELDIEELPLFFFLLIKPLLSTSVTADVTRHCLWISQESVKDEFGSVSILKQFTVDSLKALSWKKKFGFLHVIEDVLAVFDEFHIYPFLDLLMGCVVRILESCTCSLESSKCKELSLKDSGINVAASLDNVGMETDFMTSTAVKQFKELRSLCLKIVSSALAKYENHEFHSEIWDLFFKAASPLIAGFKQEGASSEKPSSLFSCFLAMSRSINFVPLLDRKRNLVPDIFSMFTITTASDVIISCVFKFVENLLILDSQLSSEDGSVKRVLLPHLNVLVGSLHSLFTRNSGTKRRPADNELVVFKLLSKYITEPSTAQKFVDILLPLLAKRFQTSDFCVVLQILQSVVEVVGSVNSSKILSSVSPLLTFSGLDVRKCICDVLNALAKDDSSVLVVAKLLSEMNATSRMDVESLDYDTIIGAYEKINREFFHTVKKEHALLILSHSVYDMSSEELVLRQSAYRLLLCFVEFASEIVELKDKSHEGWWTEALIQQIVTSFLLKHAGNAMSKGTSVQKLWIDLLREMVLKLPKVANLGSYGALYSQDPEADFFNNVIHLQKHRRARALARFSQFICNRNYSEVVSTKVFVPLFLNLLFGVQEGKGENVRSACMEAIASVAGCMTWKQYYELLMNCFREMTKREKQKVMLRLVYRILDHFHFYGTPSVHEPVDSAEDFLGAETFGSMSSGESRKCTRPANVSDIQTCIQKTMLPKIQKLLSDSDNVNVNVSLVALKLLKLLPGETMNSQLPSIVHRISNFLKHRWESVRDEARTALAACLKELGFEHLQFIVKVLRSTLKSGSELHTLGYTLNFILAKFLTNPIRGMLDYCLEDIFPVIEIDILGDVSEQKEVDKIASKMKETRKQKSFQTLKLVAQSITFRTHAVKLLSHVTAHLQKQLSPKQKSKLENMLNHIAGGIQSNPSVDQTELFIFVYRLIKDGIDDENHECKNVHMSEARKENGDLADSQMIKSVRLINSEPRYSYLITGFALGLLQNHMKVMKLNSKDGEQLSLLDPLVCLLGDCLSSKYENIVTTALRCLFPLVRLPLPSLESQSDKIKNTLLVIAHGSVNAGSPLVESCLRLLTLLLRNTRITLSADQLHMLLQFPLFVDIERNPSVVCLSLLKAIVKREVQRKLPTHEIYDIIKKVAELMITSQAESIRKKSIEILLQFLLNYPMKKKRLQQHLDFFLENLRYEHPSGREAVVEMLHTIIRRFPTASLDKQSQTIFLHLVVSLANDHDSKVRAMTGDAIKLLISRINSESCKSILDYSLTWYASERQNLWSAAAQVLGLLVEVMKQGFQKHVGDVLPRIRKILQSAVSNITNGQLNVSNEAVVPLWKEAYYSLVLLEKILNQFQKLCFEKDLEEIWEMICEFLLHPHLWLRNISDRFVTFYFEHVTGACVDARFLVRPSRLFQLAASFCYQLKTQPTVDAACTLITHNLVFTICHLHLLLRQIDYVDFPNFWSKLEDKEQGCFLKAFRMLDSRKGVSMLAYLTSDLSEQKNKPQLDFLVSYLLKRMGRISLAMETTQMKVVFYCFKSISPTILGEYKNTTLVLEDSGQNCAYQMLVPLLKVCEGYAGRVISDEMKHLAEEVSKSIEEDMGVQNFNKVKYQIRKDLQAKRDKRKQEVKLMAVVNPVRNAKRKLRIAAKHRANKKRKIMSFKMQRWTR